MLEKEIKIKLIEYLLKKKKHDIVIPEVTVGHKSSINSHVRADIFAINGEISIYEIKSEKDTLERLQNQLKNYKAYANKVNIVIAEKFLDKLNIDDSIGIYIIKKNTIKEVQKAKYHNIENINTLDYWRSDELKEFLSGYKGVFKMNKRELQCLLKNLLNTTQIYYATLFMLKHRYNNESNNIKTSLLNEGLEQFPKRGMQVSFGLTPLQEIPFGILMP